MARRLDTRLGRVEGQRNATAIRHGVSASRHRRLLRAEAAMGAVVRDALARAGIDKALATQLAVADEAAAALAAIPDTPELRRADDGEDTPLINPEDRDRAAAFIPKIMAMAKGFAEGVPPDFANASFAELLAWSLAQHSRNSP
jgi:hypothetical protein